MRLLLLSLFILAPARAAVAPGKADAIRNLLRERNVAEAESAANALVAAEPKEAEAHALLGSVRLAKGDADGGVKAYERAVELAPASSTTFVQLGDAYAFAAQKAGMLSKMGWAKKCRAAYEKAVGLDPGNLDARASLMIFYQQAPGMIGGGIDKAYAQAAEIKKLDRARGGLAYATLFAGEKKFAEAFAELETILQATPENYAALFQLGRVAALSGEKIDPGMEALKKCLALPATAGAPGHEAAHWRLGNLWERKGDKQAARSAYEAALAVNPHFPQAIEALKKLD